MFTELVVQPIFNLLVLIYALVPGHNFGLAIIIFTILVRLALWPLVKKQLHHARAMRELQPEIKKIKKAAKGNRQQESALLMELYKERKLNPFSSIGILIVQIPIFLGLYYGLKRVADDPQQIIDFSYPFMHNLPWMQTLEVDIGQFDSSLFGLVDLTRLALEAGNHIYWPAMILVVASAAAQYFQSKQLLPKDKDARSLRQILRAAGSGEQADQAEIGAAVGRGTIMFIPAIIFIVTVKLPAALSLYWFTSSSVAFLQQRKILKEEEADLELGMTSMATNPGAPSTDINAASDLAGAAIAKKLEKKSKKPKSKSSSKKRRKR